MMWEEVYNNSVKNGNESGIKYIPIKKKVSKVVINLYKLMFVRMKREKSFSRK